MAQMLAWGVVALGAVYLIFVGGGWWGIYSPYLRIATMALAAVAITAWVFVAYRNPAWRPRSAMLPAILVALGSLAISTIFSRVPRVSVEYLGYAVVLAALYLMLVRLFAEPFFAQRLIVLASMLFVVAAGAYIALVVVEWVHWWAIVGEVGIPPLRPGFGGLTYNNPSAALTMVALLAVPAVARFGGRGRRGLAVVVAVLLIIGVVALISGSRSGWFAIGVTAMGAPIVWLSSGANRRTAARWLRVRSVQVALLVVGLAAVASAVVIVPIVLRRLEEGGQDLRLAYAVAAIRMFIESPIVGTGPGTWVIQRIRMTAATETDYYIPHAHNVEVQTLAELGVVGAIAGVVLVLSLASLLRSSAVSGDRDRRWWAWATGVGLVYFGLHQVLDFYVNMPAFLLAAGLPVAYLDARASPNAKLPRPWRRLPTSLARAGALAGLAIVSIAVVGLIWQEGPAARQALAVDAANAKDWARAYPLARQAAALDPDIGSYELTAGLGAAQLGHHNEAAVYFARVALRDDLPEAWLNLAAEQAEVGDDRAALDSIRAALRLGRQRPAVAMPAGDLALRLSDPELATSAFASAVLDVPSLAADPWWQSDPLRRQVYEQVVADAMQLAPIEVRWQIALMAGQPNVARLMLEAAGIGGVPAQIVDAWSGDPAAADSLLEACGANPRDLGLVEWCGRIEGRRGNVDAANRFREMANIINLGAYHAGAELRVSEEGMLGRQLLGEPADLWAIYTYRRAAPWDILVPSLVHLKIE